ncbi:BRCT domain-containing protein [Vagococcus teuberi]
MGGGIILAVNQVHHFVITGRLQTFKRDIAIQLIELFGSHYQPFVSTNTTVLVKGFFSIDLFNVDNQSKKTIAAQQYDITQINEEDFILWVLYHLKHLSSNQEHQFIQRMKEPLSNVFLELDDCPDNQFISMVIFSLEKHYPIV